MTLYFETETECKLDFDPKEQATYVINGALDVMDFPYEAEVSLTLTDDESIRQMNCEFRQIDRSTDVLSFPLIDYETPGSFDHLASCDDYFNPESGEAMLGDIVISLPTMRRQAAEYGHSELREYSFLIVHSILHLMGYDHMEDEEREHMEAQQEKILSSLQIYR